MELLNKINDRSATVGVIGLGYVGLPLILEFGKAGLSFIGFDSDGEKIKADTGSKEKRKIQGHHSILRTAWGGWFLYYGFINKSIKKFL